MRIKILHAIASALWSYKRGDIVEVEDTEAVRWLNAGIAEAIVAEPVVEEAAVKLKSEKAVKPKKAAE